MTDQARARPDPSAPPGAVALDGPAAAAAALSPSRPPAAATPAAEPEPAPDRRRAWPLIGGLSAAHFTHHISNSLLNPLLPLIRDGFGLGYTEAGFLVTAFSLSSGISNAPIGMLADRVGARPVVTVGLLLTGALSAALAMSGAYWQLVVVLALMGLVAGSYHAPAVVLLTRTFPARMRGTVLGLHTTSGHLSFFATPVLAAALVTATGTWRTPYLWLAAAPMLVGVAVWFLLPRSHDRAPASADRLAVFRDVWTAARLAGPLVSVSVLFQMVYAALMAFAALYLVDARGFAPPVAAAFLGVPQLVAIFAAPLGGYLSDRLGRRTVITLALAGIGPAVLALTRVPNEWMLLPFAAMGMTHAMRMTTTELLVAESAPSHRRGTVLGGYYMLAQELGGFAAPLLGLVAGSVGIGAAFGGLALALAAASLLVALGRVVRGYLSVSR